jgi:hypothetical protein
MRTKHSQLGSRLKQVERIEREQTVEDATPHPFDCRCSDCARRSIEVMHVINRQDACQCEVCERYKRATSIYHHEPERLKPDIIRQKVASHPDKTDETPQPTTQRADICKPSLNTVGEAIRREKFYAFVLGLEVEQEADPLSEAHWNPGGTLSMG